jgi:hypothetical protein
MLQFAKYGVGITVVNDFCPAPAGTVGIPLQGAPEVTYYQIGRSGFVSRGTEVLQKLITATVHT